MREKVRDRGRLEHILEAIESIEEYHAQYTFEDIKKNKLIFYGFTKLVEVIGEAVYMLSTEFRDSHSDVNWRQIERMRHVLVHGYYTIDSESLWATIEDDIPELKPWIVKYLSVSSAALEDVPNAETLAAMKEAVGGHDAGVVRTDSLKCFMASFV